MECQLTRFWLTVFESSFVRARMNNMGNFGLTLSLFLSIDSRKIVCRFYLRTDVKFTSASFIGDNQAHHSHNYCNFVSFTVNSKSNYTVLRNRSDF